MINNLYFVRHGQSMANAAHVYAGQDDGIQMTDLGRRQVADAAEDIKFWAIDAIISSDLDRAFESARIVAEVIGLAEAAITTDVRLREINPGRLTGAPEHGFVEYLEYLAGHTDPTAETLEQVAVRLRGLLRELKASTAGNVLLVSHAGIGRVLQLLLVGIPMDELAERSVPNATPFELPLERLMTEAL